MWLGIQHHQGIPPIPAAEALLISAPRLVARMLL